MSNKDQFDAGPAPPNGDQNYAGILIGVNWAVFAPANIFVVLRIYTRWKISQNLGWDDAIIVLAQATNCVGMGFVMLEVHYGLGRHKYYINPNHYVGFLEYNFLDWNQVFVTLCVSKIAICMFLLRISKFAKWRIFLYGMITFLVASHLPLALLFLLQCIPVHKAWDQQVPGRCFSLVDVEKIIIVQGVFSILTDVILAAFPALLLWDMRLPKRQKIQLNCLLGLGIITALACTVRTAFSYEVKQPDVTWQGVPNALCRMIEINVGISAACMPMMRTLIIALKRRYAQRASGRYSSNRTAASQLEFYTPPTQAPWYQRIKRSVRSPPPAIDMAHDAKGFQSDHSLPQLDFNIEKLMRAPVQSRASTPKPVVKAHPKAHRPQARGKSPGWYESPENATWAKDDVLSKSNSLDLPIQGPKTKGWNDRDSENTKEEEAGFSTYKYHRNWV